MATTDTSEKGLETIIEACLLDIKGEKDEHLRWIKRTSNDFNRDYCLDEDMLRTFLQSTQMDKLARARIYETPANTISTESAVPVLPDSRCRQPASYYCLPAKPLVRNTSASLLKYKNSRLSRYGIVA